MDAAGWDERYGKAELEWGAAPNRFLVQETEGLEPGAALDIAAGEGRNAIWLAERGWVVTAVDFSRVAADKGRRLAAERGVDVQWRVADVVRFDPSPTLFDLVLIFYLHLPPNDMKKVFRSAAAALVRGGTLLVVGHDRANLAEGTGGPQDPTVLFDAKDIVAELAGLSIEKAERVLRPVEGAERDAIDTIVRARRPT